MNNFENFVNRKQSEKRKADIDNVFKTYITDTQYLTLFSCSATRVSFILSSSSSSSNQFQNRAH